MTLRTALFAGIVCFAITLFVRNVRQVILRLRQAQPLGREIGRWPELVGDTFRYFLLQASVLRQPRSWHHLIVFWGFLIISVATVELLIRGFYPPFSLAVFGLGFNALFRAMLDLTEAFVLLAILFAFFRRIVWHSPFIALTRDASLILGLIALLCITHFVLHASLIGVGQASSPWWLIGFASDATLLPISAWLGHAAALSSPAGLRLTAEVSYWLHLITILFFLNYLTYSKHAHILFALPNILLRRRAAHGVLPRRDLDDETQWGAEQCNQFSWKTLLDSYTCTECARCTLNCPAHLTGKPLNPMDVMLQIRRAIGGSTAEIAASGPRLVGGRITEEALWSCSSCGACETACPVFNEQPLAIAAMRAHLVLREGKVPPALARTFRALENAGNPWGLPAEKRLDWAAGLGVHRLAEVKEAEVLLWVGCAGAFAPEGQATTRQLVQLLQAARVNFAVLGEEESCTGDLARRTGNEFLFQTLAEQNLDRLQHYHVKEIVTTCPHCWHTLGKEYPQFGGTFRVWHHAEFLYALTEQGRLTPQPASGLAGPIVFHDPCYLGRWNGQHRTARSLIRAAQPQCTACEMPAHGRDSFCCGAGGGRFWLDQSGTRVNATRMQQALATPAQTLVTACPFCRIMLSDGLKALDAQERLRIVDIAELLAPDARR